MTLGNHSTSLGDMIFLVIGAMTPLLFQKMFGLMLSSPYTQTVLMAAIGAATGWAVKQGLDILRDAISAWRSNRPKPNNRKKGTGASGLMLALVLVFAPGCSQLTREALTKVEHRTDSVAMSAMRSDSVVFRDIIRVDTVRIPGASVTTVVTLDRDTIGHLKPLAVGLRGGRANVHVKTVGRDQIAVTATCDSLEKLVLSRDLEVMRLRSVEAVMNRTSLDSVRHDSQFTSVSVCRVPWPYKMAAWVAAFYVVMTILFILWKVLKGYASGWL